MLAKRILLLSVVVLMTMSAAHADPFEQELTSLKDKLAKQLVAKGRKKVAALDFTDLQGRRNELGRYLAEQLTVELVSADGIAVVDRANLKSILDEHKLTEEGLVNPENAKKLGQFSGVDAIIIGNLTVTDTDIILLVKAISTETAEVVAASRAKFPKTTELQQLFTSGIVPVGEVVGASGTGGSAAASVETSAIATKEIGRLRITLKNVSLLKGKSGDNRQPDDLIRGVVCSFEFTNLDLQKTLKIAHNAEAVFSPNRYVRRSKLSDSAGHEWKLSETTGLPLVACGSGGDPTSIVQLILSDKHTTPDHLFGRGPEYPIVWGGDFVSIEPGKTSRVSMTFYDLNEDCQRTDYGAKSIDFFQLESELVIGVTEPGNKIATYRLEALVFDKIIAPNSSAAQTPEVKP